MNKKFLGAVSVMPLAAAGILAFAGSAEAITLSGGVTFTGNLETPLGSPDGIIDFMDSFIGFTTTPGTDGIDDGFIGPTAGVGDFASLGLSVVQVKDLEFDAAGNLMIAAPGTNPFVNFGVVDLGLGTGPQSLTFDLTSGVLEVPAETESNGTFIGNFVYGTETVGIGNVGFSSVPGTNGYTISIETTQDVPEPASLLGLGVVGLAVAGIRRRKSAKS